MNDFKIGDEIWWIELHHGLYSYLDDICVMKGRYKSSVSMYGVNWHSITPNEKTQNWTQHVRDPLFKSKNEAIDAMIKHLEEMKNDN